MSEKQLDYETGEIKVAEIHQARAPLFARLARVMGKIERLPKTGWNDFHKYPYTTDADVSELIRPLLAEEGVAFFAEMLSAEERDNKTWCQFAYTFADGETGEIWACTWWAQALTGVDLSAQEILRQASTRRLRLDSSTSF